MFWSYGKFQDGELRVAIAPPAMDVKARALVQGSSIVGIRLRTHVTVAPTRSRYDDGLRNWFFQKLFVELKMNSATHVGCSRG